jgi:phospholipase/carboxylesterase
MRENHKNGFWVETSLGEDYGSHLMSTWQLAGLTIHLRGGTDGRGGGDGPLVLLLHGYGAPGNDLVGLAHELHVASSIRFAFPEAPLVVPDGGAPDAPGRAWWDINMMQLQMGRLVGDYTALENQLSAGLDEILPRTSALLEAIVKDMRVEPHRMVIGGFSQGAVLALHTALAMQTRPAGVLVMSGTRVRSEFVKTEACRFPGLPAVVSHGEFDPILPFNLGRQLSTDLREAGWQVDWASFRGGHGIGWEALRAAERLISRALGE